MLTLKQLEAFVQIVELGTFERASKKLNTTQSTLSKRISELESATRLQLFDRSRRNVQLTQDGERLLSLAIETINTASKAMTLGQKNKQKLHRLRVGFTELTSLTWLPNFLKAFVEECPDVHLDITIDMSRVLYQMFLDDELDFIVIPHTKENSHESNINITLVRNVEMALMSHPDLYKSGSPLPISDIDKFHLLGQGKLSGYAQNINLWLHEFGIYHPSSLIVNNLLAMLGLTIAGRGISVLPKHCITNLVNSQDLVEIITIPKLPSVGYYSIYRNGARITLLNELSRYIDKYADFSLPFFISK